MKKVRYIIIILFIFIVTGCNIKYNISFNETNVNENIEISGLNGNLQNDLIDPIYYFFQGYPYDILSNPDSSNVKQTWLSLDYFKDNSVLFKEFIDNNSIKINGKKVVIDLYVNDNVQSYLELYGKPENIEFSLIIPYYVSSHNATDVNGDIYTWKISNIENTHIKINFDMGKSKNFMKNIFSICTIVIVLVIIGSTIVYFVNKNKKNNEI